MKNGQIELSEEVVLHPEVAINIRNFLGKVPVDEVGLGNIVALENAIGTAVERQREKTVAKQNKECVTEALTKKDA